MNSFVVHTPKHKLEICYHYGFVCKDEVKVDKTLFEKMCKEGCPNYGRKYGCPPYSPDFHSYVKDVCRLFVVAFTLDLGQFDKSNYREYLKVRIANSVLKSRIERFMRILEREIDSKFLGTGACRLCKKCQIQVG